MKLYNYLTSAKYRLASLSLSHPSLRAKPFNLGNSNTTNTQFQQGLKHSMQLETAIWHRINKKL